MLNDDFWSEKCYNRWSTMVYILHVILGLSR